MVRSACCLPRIVWKITSSFYSNGMFVGPNVFFNVCVEYSMDYSYRVLTPPCAIVLFCIYILLYSISAFVSNHIFIHREFPSTLFNQAAKSWRWSTGSQQLLIATWRLSRHVVDVPSEQEHWQSPSLTWQVEAIWFHFYKMIGHYE